MSVQVIEQIAVPVMALDSITKIQGKNCSNSEGFTMSIIYHWKHLEVYFATHPREHHLELRSKNYGCLSEPCSRPMRFQNGPI